MGHRKIWKEIGLAQFAILGSDRPSWFVFIMVSVSSHFHRTTIG